MNRLSGRFIIALILLVLYGLGEVVYHSAENYARSNVGVTATNAVIAGATNRSETVPAISATKLPDFGEIHRIYDLLILSVALFLFSYSILHPFINTVLYLHLKFRTKLVLNSILILILCDFIFISYNFLSQRNLVRHAMVNQLVLIHKTFERERLWEDTSNAERISGILQNSISESKNSLELGKYLDTSPEIIDVAALGTNFEIMGFSGNETDSESFIKPAKRLIAKMIESFQRTGSVSNSPMFDLNSSVSGRVKLLDRLVGADMILIPVYRMGRLEGYYLAFFNVTGIGMAFTRMLAFNGILLLFLILMVILLISQVGESVTRNIGEMIEWTKHINNGNFDVEKKISTNDEIELLAENFDTMRLDMGNTVKQLKLLNGLTTGMQKIQDTDTLYLFFLAYLTANFGFAHNRAAFFLKKDSSLVGSYAIGMLDESEIEQRFGAVDNYRAFRIDQETFLKDYRSYLDGIQSEYIDRVKNARIPAEENSLFWDVANRQAVVYVKTDFQMMSPFDRKIAELLHTNEFVLLPFNMNNQAAGVLMIDNPFQTVVYHEKDIHQLQIALNGFAVNLERSLLIRDLETLVDQRTQELNSTLIELTRKDRLMRMDLSIAQRIQRHLLPKDVQKWKELDVVISYLPMGEVGGDFYDIAEIRPGAVRLFLADATGHGVQAALITTLIKSEYEKYKLHIRNPGELIEQLNASYIENYQYLSYFFTCIIIDLDFKKKTLTYASGGHPVQFLIRKGKLIELKPSGKIVGILDDAQFETREMPLREGDKVLLFTDGLFEQLNREMEEFSEARMIEETSKLAGEPMQRIVESLLTVMESHMKGAARTDDVTILGATYRMKD